MKPKVSESGYPAPPEVVMVTPAIATKWLEGNTHNRPIYQSVVERYARDMTKGNWRVTHQGVAFNTNGTLVDGQHRLWAIIESGKTIALLVHHGLPLESQSVIDVGATRSSRDRLWLSDKFGAVTHMECAVLKRMIAGASTLPRWTSLEEEQMFAQHKDAVRFAVNAFPGTKTRITNAVVVGVVARAYYTVPHEQLQRFCYVLFTGEALSAPERTILLLRDTLLMRAGLRMKSSAEWARTEWTLRSYLAGRTNVKLAAASSELYPLDAEGEGPSTKKSGATTEPKKFIKRRFDAGDKVRAYLTTQAVPVPMEAIRKGSRLAYHSTRAAVRSAIDAGYIARHGAAGSSRLTYALSEKGKKPWI